MPSLELREVIIISSRHSHISHYEHREVKHIKSDNYHRTGYYCYFLIIHLAEYFWEPVMHCCKEHYTHSAKHHVMEMRHNKIGICNMNICGKRSEHKSG